MYPPAVGVAVPIGAARCGHLKSPVAPNSSICPSSGNQQPTPGAWCAPRQSPQAVPASPSATAMITFQKVSMPNA